MKFLPFRKHFKRHQRYLASCFFVCKYALSIVSRHSNLKCINHTCLGTVYCPNKPSTPYLFAKSVTFTFHAVVRLSKYQLYLSTFFETSRCLGRLLLCCLFASKYVVSAIFCTLTWNFISGTHLVAFNPQKALFYSHFSFLTTVDLFSSLCWGL